MSNKVRLSDYGFTILQIETKSTCNMKCKFCPYPVRKDKWITLLDNDVFSAIDSLEPNDDKLEYICFSQFNEPLMDKRIFKFIKYAKDNNFKVLIITNGLLFNSEEIREQLIRAEPTYIKISLQTLNEDTFLKSRGINYSFEEYKKHTFEFLRLSVERRCSSEIAVDLACNFLTKKSSIMRKLGLTRGDPSVPDSVDEIESDLITVLKELKNYDACFFFDERELMDYLGQISTNYLDEAGLLIGKNIKMKVKPFTYGRKLTEFYPIRVGTGCGVRMLGILSNGSVAPCCLAYDGILSMGNIKRESLRSILDRNLDFIAGIKTGSHLPGICKKCQGAPTRRGTMYLDIRRSLGRLLIKSRLAR